jgi:2-polyprenyl-6-methoxyphenol hydroxylase-like FAD-dependent oxidoreductase
MTRSGAVVGAGVGGLSAAVGLARAGWSVTVLERWPQVVGTGAALGLWPEAQSALAELGLGPALDAVAVPYLGAELRDRSGRRLTPLPLARIRRKTGRDVVLTSRVTLMRLLLDAATGAGAVVRTDTAITDPAALAAEHDVVVGADGLRSAVRAAYFPGAAAPRDAGFTAWRGSVAGETGCYGEMWGPGRIFGLTPMEPGRTNWYAAVRGEQPRPDAAAALADLRAGYAGWAAPVPGVLAATDPADLLQHRVFDLAPALASYVSGNAVLLGDAAHAMTPMLGQGACQAVVDGVALARALTTADDVAAGLRAYDAQRRPATQRLVSASARAARVSLARRHLGARDALLRAAAPLVG